MSNRDALIEGIDEFTSGACAIVRGALARGDADAVRDWNERARSDRDALLGVGPRRRAVHELRVSVPEPPGRGGRDRARARPRRRQHRRHGALALEDNRQGVVSLWIGGDAARRARRAAHLRAGAPGGPRMIGAHMNMRPFEPARGLSGAVPRAVDKSISHRAALLGAMASEPVRIESYLHAADTHSTLAAVRALGRSSRSAARTSWCGAPACVRRATRRGRSTSAMRARSCACCPAGWPPRTGRSFTLDGDSSIRRRPVDRIAEPLGEMGAMIDARVGRFPPFEVHGARLRAISYELEVASAQVKSCVLLAALAADGATTVGEPARSRDHTERMLLRAGVGIHRNGRHVTVVNTDELLLDRVTVPGRRELGRLPGCRRRARARLAPADRTSA